MFLKVNNRIIFFMVQCKNVKVLYYSKLSSVGKISNYAIFYIGFKVLFLL